MAEKQNDEGKQVQLLRVSMRKAVEDIVGCFTTDELLPFFKDVPNMSHRKIVKMIELLKKRVIARAETQMEDVIVEANLNTLLKKRADIMQSQQDLEGTTAWRPTGSVCDDIRAHNVHALQTKKHKVEAICKSKEDEVNALAAEISKIRAEVADYQNQLKHVYESCGRLNELVLDQQQGLEGRGESLSVPLSQQSFGADN